MTERAATSEEGGDVSLDAGEISRLLGILAESVWDEAVVTVGDVTIAVARNGASLAAAGALPAPAPAPSAMPAGQGPVTAPPTPPPTPPAATPAPAVPPAVPAQAAAGVQVTAPSIGVFWRSPEPGSPPFVEVGQRVEAGQEMCIVEVMKLMNRVQAPVAGVVSTVHVGNGEAVEPATALFTIAPE